MGDKETGLGRGREDGLVIKTTSVEVDASSMFGTRSRPVVRCYHLRGAGRVSQQHHPPTSFIPPNSHHVPSPARSYVGSECLQLRRLNPTEI